MLFPAVLKIYKNLYLEFGTSNNVKSFFSEQNTYSLWGNIYNVFDDVVSCSCNKSDDADTHTRSI